MNEHKEGPDGTNATDTESEVDPALPPRQPEMGGGDQRGDILSLKIWYQHLFDSYFEWSDGDVAHVQSGSGSVEQQRRASASAQAQEVTTSSAPVQLPRFPKKPDSLLNQVRNFCFNPTIDVDYFNCLGWDWQEAEAVGELLEGPLDQRTLQKSPANGNLIYHTYYLNLNIDDFLFSVGLFRGERVFVLERRPKVEGGDAQEAGGRRRGRGQGVEGQDQGMR